MTEKKHFFGVIKPTRDDFITNPTEKDNELMSKHFLYLKDLLEKGKLVLAGPVLNEKKPMGIFIFECVTLEEAEELLKNDPSVKAGIQIVKKLEPFRLSLYKKTD
ncbi:MAG: hypothetical protein GPJ52_06390 [Candidatus Heimdallarchaeota archaeon]|nr:hypothetical protein [Candidatus Heimdallarchaeota archaeon]MCG3253937.1 hypothetical protein [Candidatus Heimdallarchaeota archaeon]MCK4291070.1 hypothetical protein [Candidatus Heimdallarchaeota archaeon]